MSSLARALIRLYPRAWRDRYEDEFVELMTGRPLTVAAVIDIVSGAIDAGLTSRARLSRLRGTQAGGVVMINALKLSCGRTTVPFTTRDGLIGAGLMLAGSVGFSAAGILLKRSGWPDVGEMLLGLAFPGSLMLAMPFTFLKGQPWRAQAVIIGGTFAMLAFIGYVAATKL